MNKKTIFRTVLAIFFGEVALILLSTFAQEVLFDSIKYSTSSNFDIYVGGFATFIAAVLAGIVAIAINLGMNYIPQIIISLFILVETIFLISSGAINDPMWADLFAGVSLIIAVWLGYFMFQRFFLKPVILS